MHDQIETVHGQELRQRWRITDIHFHQQSFRHRLGMSGTEIIDNHNLMSLRQGMQCHMRTDIACAAADEDFHNLCPVIFIAQV